MLTKNHRQEALCRSYVQAVAAMCGMSHSISSHDYANDLTLNEIRVVGRERVESGFRLDVQAKATTRSGVKGARLTYDLEARAYNWLCDPVPGCPRVLVLLVLPEDETLWL